MPADSASTPLVASAALRVAWAPDAAIVNLRGDPGDPAFVAAASQAIGMPLPLAAGDCPSSGDLRVLWAGPDDWFVLGPAGTEHALAARLRTAAAGRHRAVTDVSSGYRVLRVAGPGARDLLAQGCPLDMHPRAFALGRCAGSHFFKASIWVWRTGEDAFELLVRSSFAGYVETLVHRCTLESGR
ncbi:MAG: sarcosine oxidase subunit gamma [Burkholderiales bacterium]|nr:MAG: sarcosine oxidase subunit gamma [Burkholderiales bacterium]